jgi:hypothetical protein
MTSYKTFNTQDDPCAGYIYNMKIGRGSMMGSVCLI